MTKKMLTTIVCDYCGTSFEYEDDGVSLDCLPDGALHEGSWYCSDCIAEEEEERNMRNGNWHD